MEYLLRYKNSERLSNAYYLRPHELNLESTKLYCVGTCNYGDYIATTPVYGVVMRCPEKEIAIGISLTQKNNHEVELIDVILL